jgi:hypothetical protein
VVELNLLLSQWADSRSDWLLGPSSATARSNPLSIQAYFGDFRARVLFVKPGKDDVALNVSEGSTSLL